MNGIYKLDNGRMYAEIFALRGANPIKLIDRELDADILRSPIKLSDFETENPYLYGMPILFFPNRISGGKFSYGGREYVFPINEPTTNCSLHGTLHETPFSVVEYTKTSLKCRYRATKNAPYHSFPHEFTLDLTYSLENGNFVQRAEFKNDSDSEMPVALAFHTTLNIPFAKEGNADSVRAKIALRREFLRDKNYLPTGEILENSRYITELSDGSFCPAENTVSAFFEDAGEKKATLTDMKAGIELSYSRRELNSYALRRDFFATFAKSHLARCISCFGAFWQNSSKNSTPKGAVQF